MAGGFSCDSGIESECLLEFAGTVSALSGRGSGSTAAILGIGKARGIDSRIDASDDGQASERSLAVALA